MAENLISDEPKNIIDKMTAGGRKCKVTGCFHKNLAHKHEKHYQREVFVNGQYERHWNKEYAFPVPFRRMTLVKEVKKKGITKVYDFKTKKFVTPTVNDMCDEKKANKKCKHDCSCYLFKVGDWYSSEVQDSRTDSDIDNDRLIFQEWYRYCSNNAMTLEKSQLFLNDLILAKNMSEETCTWLNEYWKRASLNNWAICSQHFPKNGNGQKEMAKDLGNRMNRAERPACPPTNEIPSVAKSCQPKATQEPPKRKTINSSANCSMFSLNESNLIEESFYIHMCEERKKTIYIDYDES